MATTQKLPSGSWRCRVMVGGKQKSFTGSSKKEAEQKAYAYLEEHPQVTARNLSQLTFREASRHYIDTVEPVLSPSTIRAYESIYDHHFVNLRDVKIHRIDARMMQKEVSEQSLTLSAKSVRNNLSFANSVLKFHGEQPFTDLLLPQTKKEIDITIPTDAEMKAIVEASESCNIQLAVICAGYMGMRRSEICGIRLPNDYRDGRLWITKAEVETKDKQWVLSKPKTKDSTRALKVPAFAVPLIEKKIDGGEDRLVDCNPDALYDRFQRMLNQLALPHHVRFHDLRHYYASTLAILNVPYKYASALMGHSDDKMLRRVYQHIQRDYMSRFEDQIADHFKTI